LKESTNSVSIRVAAPSVRSRIYVLAALTLILLVSAAIAFVILIRNGQSATLDSAQAHLGTLARNLAEDYVNRSSWELLHSTQPALETPEQPGSNQLLALMTSAVLQHESGIEGGFYARTGELLGYAFPTHPGPGQKTDIPVHERPAITDLAQKAAQSGRIQTLRFTGPRDATVFVAYPISLNGKSLGASWMMERMPGLNAETNASLMTGMIAFAFGALACALIAFLVVAEVQNAVGAIGAYLGTLATNLSVPRPQPSRLAEFENVLREIEALAVTLREKNANERTLEAKLRHQDRLSSLGQFAAGIAHEIRNPLATIRLRIQMTQRASTDAVVARNSIVALEEIARLDAMIERLLYFSRPIQLDKEQIEMGALCREVLDAHADLATRYGVDLDLPGYELTFVLADRNQLRQVLDNIVSNAVDAVIEQAQDRRWIKCRVGGDAMWTEIVIEDSGPGLTSEAKAHAFDPFFTTKPKGTGLGLSIAYEILQAHDGQLTLSMGARGGAVVTVRLPSADPDASQAITGNSSGGVHA
jgi:signal transduction histidine kinase